MSNKVSSPLRYPGGKSKLTKYVEHILDINSIKGTYIEPFAGGAGIATNLLLKDQVDKIVINDLDPSVFSFWYFIKNNANQLIKQIEEVPFTSKECNLTPEELIIYWDSIKRKYNDNRGKKNLEEAFSFFMLNRMNRSGIISGGPIGGRSQDGKYNITVRFNKADLINRIEKISEKSDRIIVQNLDAVSLIQNVVNSSVDLTNSLLFVDPPYFYQGKNLYPSYIKENGHSLIAEALMSYKDLRWIETYDVSKQISDYYNAKEINKYLYYLRYSASTKRISAEMIFSSQNIIIDSYEKVLLQKLAFENN